MSEKKKIQEALSERSEGRFTTASPVGDGKWAADVKAYVAGTVAASDSVDSFDANLNEITAAAHVAQPGDIIRFTSGALNGREVTAYSVTTNTIKIAEELSAAPSGGDTFDILSAITQTLTSTGGVASVTTFVRDEGGGPFNQEVTEDTVTPANSRPLPVKITSATGDINITANDLNVQLSHSAATPDSVRIGDGTETVNVNASNEMQVRDDSANTLLGTIDADTSNLDVTLSTRASETTLSTLNAKFVSGTDIGDVTVNNGTFGAAVNIQDGGNVISVDDGGSTISIDDDGGSITIDDGNLSISVDDGLGSLTVDGTVTVIDGGGSLTVDTDAGALSVSATDLDVRDLTHVSDSVRLGDGTDLVNVSASNELQVLDSGANTLLGTIDTDTSTIAAAVVAGQMQVDVVAPLPTGDNNIGNVDVVSSVLPTGAATESTLATIDTDTGNIATSTSTIAGAVSGTEMRVDIIDPLPAGTNTIGAVNVNNLDVVDFFDTFLLDASVTNIPTATFRQVVLSLAANVSKIQVFDTTGEFFGIYVGGGGSEVLAAIVGPGSNETVEVSISSGSRITLQSLTGSDINLGNVAMNFMG